MISFIMSPVDQIKQKLDIVEFIGQYVQLKKAGRNFKANCPFHQEKSPSFVISPDRQIWHCFGSCGIGGDVVTFWMKWENLTFAEALKELAVIAGVQLDSSTYNDAEQIEKEKIISINTLTAKYYSYILHKTPYGAKALEYLKGRGINDKIIQTFEIGYAPSSWDSLLKFFQKKNISQEDLNKAGLVVQSSSGTRFYDRFRNRIMFPIRDGKGTVIGFSGRVLNPDEKSAKYVNTPETLIYRKRESLYGIHLTKDSIRREDNVYIVEGEFDMITPFQHGVGNIVAIKGAALTTEQLAILKRYTNRISLALDTDEAGIEAMKRGIREAEKMDFDIQIVEFTSGKDPDEAIKNDPISFKKDLKKTVPIYDFLLTQFGKKYAGDSPFQKKKIAEEMAPFISHINNPIVHSYYIKKIAHILDVDETSVNQIIYAQRAKEKRSFRSKALPTEIKSASREDLIQKYIISVILQHDDIPTLVTKVFKVIDPEDFWFPAYKNLAEQLKTFKPTEGTGYDVFAKTLTPALVAVADELFMFATSEQLLEQTNIPQLMYDFKLFSYKYFLSLYAKENNEEKVLYYNQRLRNLNKNDIVLL